MADSTKSLVASPTVQLADYPKWKDEIAKPALQEYLAGKIDLATLGKRLAVVVVARTPHAKARKTSSVRLPR